MVLVNRTLNTSTSDVLKDYFDLSVLEFYSVHTLAGIIPLVLSLVPCIIMLACLLCRGTSLYKRPIGDRLTVYLAMCDLCYSLQDLSQHIFLLTTKRPLSYSHCSFVGSGTFGFLVAQSLLVLFIAANSFVMVVKQRKINIGRGDWRLLSVSFGGPAILVVIFNSLGWMGTGPHGIWCLFDTESQVGAILQLCTSLNSVVVFTANIVLYTLVWIKLHKLAVNSTVTAGKYDKLAKVMMVYVLVYLVQWVPGIVYAWMFAFGMAAPYALLFNATLFINLGGLLNCIAYTFVRKRTRQVAADTSYATSLNTNTQQT